MTSLCSEDGTASASVCCLCVYPTPYLCERHAEEHKQKPGLHLIVPIAAKVLVHSQLDYMQMQGWLFQISHAQRLIQINLAEVTTCSQAIDTAYKELVEAALDAKQHYQANLMSLKEKLEELKRESWEETKQHLLEMQDYKPIHTMTSFVWKHNPSVRESLNLFKFRVQSGAEILRRNFPVSFETTIPELAKFNTPNSEPGTDPIQDINGEQQRLIKKIRTLVHTNKKQRNRIIELEREKETLEAQLKDPSTMSPHKHMKVTESAPLPQSLSLGPVPTDLLVAVDASTLTVFNSVTESWLQVSLTANSRVDPTYTVVTLIDNETVFCCGGAECPKLAVILKMDGKVSPQEDMIQGRVLPGVVMYERNVYVFGGGLCPSIFMAMRSCEFFSLDDLKWGELPNMSEKRYQLNPCVHLHSVYLVGGYAQTAEVFHPSDRTFSPIPNFNMPWGFTETACLVVVHEQCLVVISGTKMMKYGLQECAVQRVQEHSPCNTSCCSPALVRDNCCYFLVTLDDHLQTCQVLCLKTGSVLRHLHFLLSSS